MTKTAIITGITGQDGAYLADLLLEKGYQVHGIRRRNSADNLERIKHITVGPQEESNFHLHYGDLGDSGNLLRLIEEIKPDEIYNLAAQSHVRVSFDSPEYTADVNGLGVLRLLEAIRTLHLTSKTKFYQASTSELYGLIQDPVQTEKTPFYPRSPYGIAKLYAYWITVNYREAYGIYACNGILFNHESPIRGEAFVTRKITQAIGRMMFGLQKCLYMGNLNAERDWGHAKDYVKMQWLMLQQDKPEDFVISTGQKHTVREFIEIAFRHCGISIRWEGEGIHEKGIVDTINNKNDILKKINPKQHISPGDTLIKIDSYYFRPTEVNCLIGDSTKAKNKLNWEPQISFEDLVIEMIQSDIKNAYKEHILKENSLDQH